MTRILITGSNSFVGSNFVKYSRYPDVEEISLFGYKSGKIDFNAYDVILHLVAIVHQTFAIPEEEYYKINYELTLQVARDAKAAGVKQFIFLSTIKVYGKFDNNQGKWNESSLCYPDDPYGKSKYKAERGLLELENENFIVSIVRSPLVYGDGVKANMSHIIKLISRLRFLPFKNTHNKRHFTAAENLVAFIDRIIEIKASGVFIAMDQKAISTEELVKLIAEGMNRKITLFHLPDALIRLGIKLLPSIFERLYGSFEIDNSETLKRLNFVPPLSFEDGIRKMVSLIAENDKSIRNIKRIKIHQNKP